MPDQITTFTIAEDDLEELEHLAEMLLFALIEKSTDRLSEIRQRIKHIALRVRGVKE